MNYIELDGLNIEADKKLISDTLSSSTDLIFIFTNTRKKLHGYIDALNEAGLNDSQLFKFKVCYERKNLDLIYSDKDVRSVRIHSISELIRRLDRATQCRVVVNDNERSTLADIVQQLIYIEYPLPLVNIMLKKEEKDADKTARFMREVHNLSEKAEKTLVRLGNIEIVGNDEKINERIEILDKVKSSFKHINDLIKKAMDVELKIAVAASKKTGKSVIANSMIGEELAPTSLEMATPNTCVYKKSKDDKYHLMYNGKEEVFSTSGGIYKFIDNEFKKAQIDDKNKYTIDDMEIRYPVKENNFSSFTIYDTPGPDAAGTGHAQKAAESIKKSDVAVFAIDYSKYLTNSEEEYLKEVKTLFNENQKFNSLIFVLNKMDQRYIDAKSTKSIIKSIDFIRERLREIDPCYSDCIIFATSALQYFNCIETEKICGDKLRNAENLMTTLMPLSAEHSDVVGQLLFLNSQVAYMQGFHGLMNITLNDLKKYSGMPDLLNYAKYIAQTKARDEIINNITVKVDAENSYVKTIIDRVENIRRLISESDANIKKIENIINTFKQDVEAILIDFFNQDDIAVLDDNSIKILNAYKNTADAKKITLNFSTISDIVTSELKKKIDSRELNKPFYNMIENRTWTKIKNSFGECLSKNDINNLINNDLIKKCAAEVIDLRINRRTETEKDNIGKLSRICNEIVNGRIERLKKCIDSCREELSKFDTQYQLPELPSFDFQLPDIQQSAELTNKKINFSKIKLIGEGNPFLKRTNAFKQFWNNLLDGEFGRKTYKIEYVDKTRFDDWFAKMHRPICDIADEDIQLCKLFEQEMDKVANEYKKCIDEINSQFEDISGTLKESIKEFTRIVDDRKIYIEQKDLAEKEAELIHQIENSNDEFAKSWNNVIHDIINS